MTAISDRLDRGLQAAKEGDMDTARSILGEMADADTGWEPVGGLSPETEAQYYELLGDVLEHDNDSDMAEEAYDRMEALQNEASELVGDDVVDEDAANVPWEDAYDNSFGLERYATADDETTTELAEVEELPPGSLSPVRELDAEHRWYRTDVLAYDNKGYEHNAHYSGDAMAVLSTDDAGTIYETINAVETASESTVYENGHPDQGWKEKHVESVTVTRTTYVYDDPDHSAAALPAPIDVQDDTE